MPVSLAFPTNGSQLTFSVPSIGVNEQFQRSTRDESVDLLVNFLESDGGSTLNRIQEELVRVSPVDPIAGNPNSLQSRMH